MKTLLCIVYCAYVRKIRGRSEQFVSLVTEPVELMTTNEGAGNHACAAVHCNRLGQGSFQLPKVTRVWNAVAEYLKINARWCQVDQQLWTLSRGTWRRCCSVICNQWSVFLLRCTSFLVRWTLSETLASVLLYITLLRSLNPHITFPIPKI